MSPTYLNILAVFYFLLPLFAHSTPLASPLTLESALSFADDERHPDNLFAQSTLDLSQSTISEAKQPLLPELHLRIEGRQIGAPSSIVTQRNDSRASLNLRQTLFDFGKTSANIHAAKLHLNSEEFALLSHRQQQRLTIMTHFFNVILADLQEQRDNEAMTIKYLRYDKLKERVQLGMVSNEQLLQSQSAYEQSKVTYDASGRAQRETRLSLALSLGHPDKLPSELVTPEFNPQLLSQSIDIEQLTRDALHQSYDLQSASLALNSAQAKFIAAKKSRLPVIYAQATARHYQRLTGSSYPWEVGITIDMPLLDGGRQKTALLKTHANVTQKTAIRQQMNDQIRQKAMTLWQSYHSLVSRIKALRIEGEYQELLMDKSRSLYEMEVNTDFGESLVRLSDYELKKTEAEFSLTLVDAKIKALKGQLLETIP